MVREPPFITNPQLIDPFILTRHDALDNNISTRFSLAPYIHGQVATHRALRADRSRVGQFPGTRPKSKIRSCQRPNRADIGAIAREIRIETRFRGCDDFGGTTPQVKLDHRVIGDFFLVTNAPSALDAALLIEVNQLPQGDMLPQMHFFIK